jgi:hypothetical protein
MCRWTLGFPAHLEPCCLLRRGRAHVRPTDWGVDGRCGGAGRRRVSWWRRADDAHVGGSATCARQARPCEMAGYMSRWTCWIDCNRFASVTLPECYMDRGEHSRQASRPVHMRLGAKGTAVSHVSCRPLHSTVGTYSSAEGDGTWLLASRATARAIKTAERDESVSRFTATREALGERRRWQPDVWLLLVRRACACSVQPMVARREPCHGCRSSRSQGRREK